jgi:tRNA U34 5-methylaminomethyl-2-thiouridine-forming methyltransferase MnmC
VIDSLVMVHKLIKTGDGSHSLFVEELNEHYHSVHGAIQESKHVFIEAGLKQISSSLPEEKQHKTISILEVGLGTGLNALLTILENKQLKMKLSYSALEAFPLKQEVTSHLNYIDLLTDQIHSKEELRFFFDAIHVSAWNQKVEIIPEFNLNKILNSLQQVQFQDTYNLVYFDAFGPVVQPEMWSKDMFFKIYGAMKEQGILVTYCAKGIVKRTLKEVGFKIETLQGPPGKREMIRAIKIS